MSNNILDELDQLLLALQWTTEHEGLETAYTTGERIMINQERASLFRALDGEPTGFVQNPEIIEKTTRILYLINRTGWVPLN